MRKKSTRQSKESRVSAILTAARSEFESHGYERAKVSNIAARADVVEGTVFSYFSSKRALVLAVMGQFYREINATINAGIGEVSGFEQKLHFVIWNHLNIVSRNRELCGVILRESRGVDSTLSAQVHELNRAYTSVVAKLVYDAINDQTLASDTPIHLVRNTLFGTIEHYLWDLLATGNNLDVDAVAKQILNTILGGLSANSYYTE